MEIEPERRRGIDEGAQTIARRAVAFKKTNLILNQYEVMIIIYCSYTQRSIFGTKGIKSIQFTFDG